MKTPAANRYVPLSQELVEMLQKVRGFPGQYVFRNKDGEPLSQNTFKRKWLSLMRDCGLVEEREIKTKSEYSADILYRLRPTITPHYMRHNFVTMLYEAGVNPLVAMKIVGHTDYQTTANIYTHLNEDCLRKAGMDMERVFAKRALKRDEKTTEINPYGSESRLDMPMSWAQVFENKNII